MTDWNGLFREYPRLAKKLSNDEIKGIKSFIEQQLYHQHSDLCSKLVYLESQLHHNQQEQHTNLSQLTTQVNEEKYLAQEYKREFKSITDVLQSREIRYKKHTTNFEDRIEELRLDLDKKDEALKSVELQLTEQLKLNDQYQKEIVELEKMCLKLVREKDESLENSRLSGEILKLKYGLCNKDKEIVRLKKVLGLGTKAVTCDGKRCLFARYFRECRTELITKCEQNAILSYQVEEGKRTLKEHKATLSLIENRK